MVYGFFKHSILELEINIMLPLLSILDFGQTMLKMCH